MNDSLCIGLCLQRYFVNDSLCFGLCLQRYFVNDSFYEPGGPVFLMIGGEGTASPIWMVEGEPQT